jgi:hypothetical protein
MKKMSKSKLIKLLKVTLLILFLVSIDADINSQPGMPPDHGQNGNQGAGGTAPLGEGLIFFLLSAAFYSIRKIKSARKKTE